MRRISLALVVLLLSCCATAPTRLEAGFSRFLSWFPGRYDNALQVREEAAQELAEELRNYRRHSIFRRVDLPAFGPVVFYAEQYRDGDPNKIYRQRIYVLSIDREREAIRLRVHVPHETPSLAGAYREPNVLSALTPEQTTVWDGCDVFWRAEPERFVGSLDPGTCQFDSVAFGQRIQLEETLTLFSDAMWFADRGLTLDGDYLFGMRGNVPAKALRVRSYRCVGSAGQTWWTHDQGGWFTLPSGECQRGLVIEMQRLADSSGNLTLAAKVGKEVTEVATTSGNEIGMTAGTQTIHCVPAPEQLFDDRSR